MFIPRLSPALPLLFATLALPFAVPAADPVRTGTNALPLGTPANLNTLLKSFQIHPGFRLELVAAEPLVMDPIAMAFDESGRLFVIESRASTGKNGSHRGRIRLLEDQDGDGSFDVSSIYADDLESPSALIYFDGGIFVAAGPEILYLKDSQRDGHADIRRVVLTDYAPTANKVNGQISFTGFAWGLDNRIHVATAGTGGDILTGTTPGNGVTLSEGNFSFDPRDFRIQSEGGSGPTGICFDSRGRKFVGSANDHIALVMNESRYAARNPWLEAPPSLLAIAKDGRATPLFARRPVANAGQSRRPATAIPAATTTYFSAAGGLMIYRGNLFGPDYSENAFVTDAVAGIIHRDKLRLNGLELVAERTADEGGIEFLAGSDPTFQPVQVINGPEGALYLADFTRPVTPGAAPHGRIYRIVPARFEQPDPWPMGELTTAELVACFRHTDGWDRETAARLLYERQDPAAVGPLGRLIFDPKSPGWARMYALRALDGLHRLTPQHVIHGLADPDERVRIHALQLAERFLVSPGPTPPGLADSITALGDDPSIRVRHQAACTLGLLRDPRQIAALVTILGHDPANAWVQSAVAIAAGAGAADVLSAAAPNPALRSAAAVGDFLANLARTVGHRNQPGELARTLSTVANIPESEVAFRLVLGLDEVLREANNSLSQADSQGILGALFNRAKNVVVNESAGEGARLAAIRVLGLGGYPVAGDFLLGLVYTSQSPGLTVAAIQSLGNWNDERVSASLLARWPFLSPAARRATVGILLNWPARTQTLLAGFQSGQFTRDLLASPDLRFLVQHPDPALRQQARQLFGDGRNTSPAGLVARYLPAATMPGNAAHGRELYRERCASCHRIGSQGDRLGLDLAAAVRNGRSTLVTNILDPERFLSPGRASSCVVMRDGETLTGFIVRQSATSLSLRKSTGELRVLSRHLITSVTTLGGSSMPEGLASGWRASDLADLLEFLVTATP